jgi:hypothetical protein
MAEGKNDKSSRKGETARSGRRAAAAAHNFAEASRDASETGRRAAEKAGETGRRGVEAVQGATERASELASEMYSRSARETTQGLEAAVKYGTVLASGMQTLWQEMIGCAQDAMQRNVDGLQNMMRSRSPGDFLAAQTDLIREEMQAFIDSGSRISEVSARIASDAARAFGERYGEGDGGMRHGGAPQQGGRATQRSSLAGPSAGHSGQSRT